MTTLRWTFTDVETSETYTVPINPDTMTSPYHDRRFDHAVGPRLVGATRIATFRQVDPPKEWEFSGVIRSQAHHDALEDWSKKSGKVRISDHLGRVFEVLLTGFAPLDRKPTGQTPWRLRYSMTALVLRQITD